VTIGGLARSDAAGGFDTEFADLTESLRTQHEGSVPGDAAADAGDAETTGTDADRNEAALTTPDGE
jgi:hypothetical protein